MKKEKKIPVSEIVDGKIELHFDCSESTMDWIRYARLKKKAEEGEQEAYKLLQEMEDSEMEYDD